NSFVASPQALVVNNIFNLNGLGGIAAQQLSATAGYVSGFNLNTDGYGGDTSISPYDFSADPRSVNPAGADGILGGDGFADDNFRLRNSTNPAQRSAAIDAGSGLASAVGITGSTQPDGRPDEGRIDLG